ncbi:hypothetical protein ACQKIK_16505 [Pseudomonas sp. NPDC047961]
MEKVVSRQELASCLKQLAAASLLVLSIQGPGNEIVTSIRSLGSVAEIIEHPHLDLPDGAYVVKYEPGDEEEQDSQDPIIKDYAADWTAQFKLARGPVTGGYSQLLEALSNYEYVVNVTRESYGVVGHMLVALPEDPVALAELKEILSDYSLWFAVPDETGELHPGNMRPGRGIDIGIDRMFNALRAKR